MSTGGEQTWRLDADHPWPGLAAYVESASEFFFGRGDETEGLLRLVRLAPLTVVYGKSGLGKTSLLQAGLFPSLRRTHYLPVYLRLDFSESSGAAPLHQVMRRLQEELQRNSAEYSPPEADERAWEYLHRKDLEIWSADNFPLVPVLVFDQFEELFSRTAGNAALISQVFDGLADLIENRIPGDIADAASSTRRSRLDLASQRYRIVLSFREDFLPDVKTWEPKVPSLLRNYLRLEPLSRGHAIEAVDRAGQTVLAKGVAPVIVDFVGRLDQTVDADATDVTIEPVLLSLCCYQLNLRRTAGSLIDAALVKSAGQHILDRFYRDALDDPDVKGMPEVSLFIEDYLIQGDHYRGDYPVKEALDDHKLSSKQLSALTDRLRLLRIEHRAGVARVELIHDRIVPVVRKARDERRIRAKADREREIADREREKAERDRARARSEELQRQKDEVTKSLRVASISRNVAAALAVVSLIVMAWGWRQRLEKDRLKLSADVAASAASFAEGRQALGVGTEPLEQAMYRGLAAYRLSTIDEGLSQARAASLTALHFVLESSSHLRKAVTMTGFVPTPALAYSPDGRTLAVGGEDGLIRLLDGETYRDTQRRLDCGQRPAEPVWTLSFNGDGTRLAAGYATYDPGEPGSGLVCVFDLSRLEVVRSWSTKALRGERSSVYGVAYSVKPGTDFVIAGGSDGVLRVLDVGTGRVLELPQEGAVDSVAVSADGLFVASGSDDTLVRVWSLSDLSSPGARPAPLMLVGHGATVNQVSFSPVDPSVLVSASDDGRLMVWSVKGGAAREWCLVQQSHVQAARIYGFAVSPNGEMVAAAGADGDVRLFRLLDVESPCNRPTLRGKPAALASTPEFDVAPEGLLSGHGGLVLAAAYHPKGRQLASAGQDGSIRVWSAQTGGFSLAQFEVASGATALAISPNGKFIASGDEQGDIRLWDRPADNVEPGPSPVARWKAHGSAINGLAYVQAGDSLMLVSGGADGAVRRWDPVKHVAAGPDLTDLARPIRSIAVAPTGTMLAAGSEDGTIRLWNAATGQRVREIARPGDITSDYQLYAVGYTADGKHLVVGSLDPRVRVVDLDAPDAEHFLLGHSDPVRALARGRDRWLLSASQDGSVLEWQEDALVQSRSQSLKKQDQFTFRMGFRDPRPLTAMAASADSWLILTGGDNGQVQLWDGIAHLLVGSRFLGHANEPIRSVAMAADGSFFATADSERVLVWPGPTRWADLICSKLVVNMSREQWRAWISPAIPYQSQCEGLAVPP